MEYIINPQYIKKSKITLGYLDHDEYVDHNSLILSGVLKAAQKHDIKLIRFGYYLMKNVEKHIKQMDMIQDLIKQSPIDGLMFLGWTGEAESVIRNFQSSNSFPIFSIGTYFKDVPNVFTPGHLYLREILLHLINVHNLRKIAYIAPHARDERNDYYINTMKEFGIYNPDLYVDGLEFKNLNHPYRAKRALEILIDERKMNFDAIVTLYKKETEYVIEGLKSRGINVPDDVAVTSYEDDDNGRFSIPSYTSVYFPWAELGYYGCEKMLELLTKGQVAASTTVVGEVVYRNSCGCKSNFSSKYKVEHNKPAGNNLNNISTIEKEAIIGKLNKQYLLSSFDFEKLFSSFMEDYKNRTYTFFLSELLFQLKDISYKNKNTEIENMVMSIRNLILPYLMDVEDALLWSGNLFQKAQILIKDKLANIQGFKEVTLSNQNQALQETSQLLMKSFSIEDLFKALGQNLIRMEIPSCYLILSDNFLNKGSSKEFFEKCIVAYEFVNFKPVLPHGIKKSSASKIILDIINSKQKKSTIFFQLLHVNDDFMGFIMFELGPKDERVYQIISSQISIALRGVFLLEKLEKSYKKLIEQAYREGMADITAGILHNIGNAFSSINSSVQMMNEIVNIFPMDDLRKANIMLKENMENIEDFVLKDPKGRKLMQFYIRLGTNFSESKKHILYHINRMQEKIYSVNDTISAQQSYAGIELMPEMLDIATVVEDVLKVHNVELDKTNVVVTRDYQSMTRVMVQRGKLFHILSNLIKNAIEAMNESRQSDKKLLISLSQDDTGNYIAITDNGCGIPESLIEKIFSYGFSTKKEGQGLGLYSSASYMAEMGGEIWAESMGPGKGAKFILHFAKY